MNGKKYGFIYKPSDKKVPDYCNDAWIIDMKIDSSKFEKEPRSTDENIRFLDFDKKIKNKT